MAERWLRWYDGTVRDGKIRIVAGIAEEPVASIIGIWASLLEDASTSVPRGIATKGIKWHSLYLELTEAFLGTVWNAMEQVRMIEIVGDNIRIVNWPKRQFESDYVDPTAKHRKDKWKQRHSMDGTDRNDLERFGTPETETETETEKKVLLDHPSDDPKNVRHETKKKGKGTSDGSKGTRLPEGWLPSSEVHLFSVGLLGESGTAYQLDKFRDYWLGKAGAAARKTDWDRTFRNWCRSAKERNGNGYNRPQTLKERTADALQRLGSGSLGEIVDIGLPKLGLD